VGLVFGLLVLMVVVVCGFGVRANVGWNIDEVKMSFEDSTLICAA
jgi:hypothetical protein